MTQSPRSVVKRTRLIGDTLACAVGFVPVQDAFLNSEARSRKRAVCFRVSARLRRERSPRRSRRRRSPRRVRSRRRDRCARRRRCARGWRRSPTRGARRGSTVTPSHSSESATTAPRLDRAAVAEHGVRPDRRHPARSGRPCPTKTGGRTAEAGTVSRPGPSISGVEPERHHAVEDVAVGAQVGLGLAEVDPVVVGGEGVERAAARGDELGERLALDRDRAARRGSGRGPRARGGRCRR